MKTMEVFVTSYFREFGDMMTGYIGNLGWNRFRMPLWFVLLAYLVITVFAIVKSDNDFHLSVKQKLILFLVVGCTTVLIMLSQYLTWNPVGNDKLWPMMGRYFTPVYPMLFLLFSSNRIRQTKWVMALFFGYAFFATGYSLYRMNDSFYSSQNLELVWSYDFGAKNQTSLETEHVFEFGKVNGNSNLVFISDSTDSIGIKLNEGNSFGYPVTFYSLTKGDKIEVEAWRSHSETKFVFDDKPESNYYTATCHSTKLWENEYELITESYFCKEDFEELKVYLYHTSADTGYAKGYKINYYKLK